MHGPESHHHAEPRWALWGALYALLIVYASTIISPLGVNFVPQEPAAVWRRFLAIGMGSLSSDQRADWMGNLGMLMPLGFCLTGALAQARPHPSTRPSARAWAAIAALAIAVAFVIGVKYLQLFFPPRTVNLAYIIAQSLGAALGIALYLAAYPTMRRAWVEIAHASHRGLVWLLTAYAIGVLVFMLAPFDVVVSAADMAERWRGLAGGFLAAPGQGRPGHQRLAIIAANIGLLAPVGALLFTLRPADGIARAVARALALLLAANAVSIFIISTTPTLAAIVLRGIGIALGAVGMAWLGRQELRRWRGHLAWLALLAVPAYLGLLLLANGLAVRHWQGLDPLLGMDPRLLLPLWSHYIVSKAQAIKSVGVHLAMYAPIGTAMWAFKGSGRAQMATAGVLGFMLALAVEAGRAIGPGLAPDFNNAVIGAIAAAAAVPTSRVVWTMLENIPLHHAAARQ